MDIFIDVKNLKIYIFGTVLTIIILGAVTFIFREIQKSSEELISQKKELILFEQKEESLENLKEKYKVHRQNLEKINNFFVDPALPIEFIKFLEKSALDSQATIEVSLAKEIAEPEPALSFNASLSCSFSNLLKFIDKLENGPYFIEITNLNIRKLPPESSGIVAANLELIILTK